MADPSTPAAPDEVVDAFMAILDDTDCPDDDHLLCPRCAGEVTAKVFAPFVAEVNHARRERDAARATIARALDQIRDMKERNRAADRADWADEWAGINVNSALRDLYRTLAGADEAGESHA